MSVNIAQQDVPLPAHSKSRECYMPRRTRKHTDTRTVENNQKKRPPPLRGLLGLLRRLRLFGLFQVHKSLQLAAKHPHYTTTRPSVQAF